MKLGWKGGKRDGCLMLGVGLWSCNEKSCCVASNMTRVRRLFVTALQFDRIM